MNTPSTTLPAAPVTAQVLARRDAVARVAQQSLAPNTLRGYRVDATRFRSWCADPKHPHVALPASDEAVVAFLSDEVLEGYKVGTLRRRVASIASMHRMAELPNPCESQLVKYKLRELARELGTGQKQAAPLTERELLRIRARLGDSPRDIRDTAVLLVGRDLLARASELVALRVEDVQVVDSGAVVALRRHKTDTEARPYFIGAEAVAALQQWLQLAGIAAGAVFRSVNKAGKVSASALSTRDIGRILKARAIQAQLPGAAGVSAHSLRTGMACDLVAANLEVSAVMAAGGWSTPSMVARYTAGLAAQRGAVARYYGAQR